MLHVVASLLTLWATSGAPAAEAPAPPFDPTSAYEQRRMQGFRVYVNPKVRAHPTEAEEALKLLDEKLAEVVRLLPTDRLKRLRSTAIWLEWEAKPNGAAEYHPSVEWLRANGYNPEKARGVEINNAPHFVAWTRTDQPMMILHELAHAYHHNVFGYDDPAIEREYQRALKSGLYDSVAHVRGGKQRHYALTSAQEYFAEMSECYLGKNDFFPFTREELRTCDPAGYALMVRVWGEPRP